ncbi:hypothetical protein DFH08DRAFT_101892 [Mycena albidolilacea]|uniref:Uncharacterized protein n=1 Tax=Mycena albidolilacea TaxID=1033008 RepID=A0AAD6YZ26_9AGAR|nr:hypothetical protein DFH08DRAFT_101892 [Mycena albidolilacea]
MRKSYTAIHRDAATAVEEQSGGDIRIQGIDDSPANSGLLSEKISRDMPTVYLDQQLQDSGSDNARGIPPQYISPASSTGSEDVHKLHDSATNHRGPTTGVSQGATEARRGSKLTTPARGSRVFFFNGTGATEYATVERVEKSLYNPPVLHLKTDQGRLLSLPASSVNKV